MIEVNREEQDRIHRHLGITRAWFRRRYLFRFDSESESLRMNRRTGACVFLEDGRCLFAYRRVRATLRVRG